jgi:uncharacterized membrane protein YphA (DoxX/SURF4 family)
MTEANALIEGMGTPAIAQKRFVEPYTVLRVTLGLLLIVSALLKGHQLATDPFGRTGLPGPRWVGIALVELEFLLGVWLLSGLAAKAASAVATLGFCAFACVSLFKAISGEESCGCFGKVAMSPWISVGISVSAVVSLLLVPSPARSRAFNGRSMGLMAAPIALAVWGGFKMTEMSWPNSEKAIGLIGAESLHDFGTINPTQTPRSEYVFLLRNTSDHPIRILETSSTCGCTTATTATQVVEPGQHTEVRVALDLRNRIGQRMEEVHLLTDDRKTKHVRLSVRANVRPIVRTSPPAIDFGLIESDAVARRGVSVRGAPEQDLRIVSVEYPQDMVSVARVNAQGMADPASPLEGPPGSFEVTLKSAGESGEVSTAVVFQTNVPEQPRLKLPIRAERRSEMVVSPSSVLLRRAPHGFEPQMVRIGSRDIPTMQITAGDFSVEEVESSDESNRAVLVRCMGTDEKKVHRGNLQVFSNGRTVNVPLMAVAF